MPLSIPRFTILSFVLCALTSVSAFTVKRNVNAAEPPQDAVVIFDKTTSHDNLQLEPNGKNCTIDFAADGALQIHFKSNTEANPEIRWTGGIPETLDLTDYQYVVMRCQWTGSQTRTFPNGRTREEEPANPWFVTMMLDTEGVRTAGLNVAVITGKDSVPREMTTLKIPVALYLQGAFNDTSKIEAVAFKMGGTHSYYDRNYTFIIEKISLAN
ncbi:hypothetical protein [Cerasicoccus maritimus]|uniref:hypothetical protein n=1 Tax=Cerasicoccus maritimus TaxID=490089 RepID=UPI0028526F9C|nr:hypothetical protein [Cerasicoccus maritimus]